MSYFDANATTPLCPAALLAAGSAERDFWYNPSSPYPLGAAVHNRLQSARQTLAATLGTDAELIVFNSGASEAAYNLFHYLAGVFSSEATVAISAIEHPCVRESAHHFFPGRVIEIPVSSDGVADLAALASIASDSACTPSLIALMAANNETGVLQPWQEARRIAHAHGIPFYTDASQWLGKESADHLGKADFVSGCGHKFGGPKGVGFLNIGSDFTGFASQRGGAQENGHRAGTENYPAIAGLLAALSDREERLQAQQQSWLAGRDAFETALEQGIPGLRVIGKNVPRLTNTSALLLPRHRNTRWVARLAKRGFYVSTGSACAAGKAGPSYVLDAMGVPPEEAERCVRVSALWEDGQSADWQALAQAFIAVWAELNAEDGGSRSSLSSVISI